MNDSEKRREKLLRETRSQYSGRRTPPAVHPRYRSVYRSLYGGEEKTNGSTLGIRIFVCLILFGIFAAADYREERIWKFTPSQIVSEIGKQQLFLPEGEGIMGKETLKEVTQ